MPIILLDLNYTFVANSETKRAPFSRQIAHEVYRDWLLEVLLGHKILLVTARPDRYRELTLRRIKELTGWTPDEAYFNQTPMPPHIFKRELFTSTIRAKHGRGPYVAVESNPRTIVEYRKMGIFCLSVTGVMKDHRPGRVGDDET